MVSVKKEVAEWSNPLLNDGRKRRTNNELKYLLFAHEVVPYVQELTGGATRHRTWRPCISCRNRLWIWKHRRMIPASGSAMLFRPSGWRIGAGN